MDSKQVASVLREAANSRGVMGVILVVVDNEDLSRAERYQTVLAIEDGIDEEFCQLVFNGIIRYLRTAHQVKFSDIETMFREELKRFQNNDKEV